MSEIETSKAVIGAVAQELSRSAGDEANWPIPNIGSFILSHRTSQFKACKKYNPTQKYYELVATYVPTESAWQYPMRQTLFDSTGQIHASVSHTYNELYPNDAQINFDLDLEVAYGMSTPTINDYLHLGEVLLEGLAIRRPLLAIKMVS